MMRRAACNWQSLKAQPHLDLLDGRNWQSLGAASQWQHTWRGHYVHRVANPPLQNNGQLMGAIKLTKLRALTPTQAHTPNYTPTYAYTL